MRPNRLLISSTVFLLIFASGCENQRDDGAARPRSRVVVPETAENQGGSGPVQTDTSFVEDQRSPKVDLESGDMLVTVHNMNLDLHRTEEQILALKRGNDPSAPIRIAVVAYDSVLNGFVLSFEGETTAQSARSFTVSFIDMVGDHSTEIVARGMTNDGLQTIDVFRRTTSPQGFGLYYENICSLAVDGTIEIEVVERDDSYKENLTNGRSYPIVTLRHDKESEKMLDLIKNTWYWRFPERRYVMEKEELVPGAEVEQRQLSELYMSGEAAFREFLDGSWFLVSGGETDNAILHFEPKKSRFVYFIGDVQEVYAWNTTYKTLVSRVAITGFNELVPYMSKYLYIQVDGLDTIRVLGIDPWRGTYRRISEGAAGSLFPGYNVRTYDSADFSLSGEWVSDTGVEMTFSRPDFVRSGGEGEGERGKYTLYSIGSSTILELKIVAPTGVVTESRRYRARYEEETRDDRIYRTLFLTPGIIGAYGFEETREDSIRFEQSLAVEDQPSDGD